MSSQNKRFQKKFAYLKFKDMKLKNKVAVITGGNSGIGLGIAKALKSEGVTGVITGRNKKTLEESIVALGDSFVGVMADVTKMTDLDYLFGEASKNNNKIDILVVNAGGAVENAKMGKISEIEEEDFDSYMNLNLKSVYFTIKKALPYMNDGGSIVLIGSTAAHQASQGMAVYSAAKAAVISFARGLSLDLLERKIRVNVVSPGTIDTPAFDRFLPEDQVENVKKAWVNSIPVARIGQPSDVGNAVVFLASHESSFILGTEIIVDGGMINIAVK